ncbi:NUDIX hydrolase [Acinetobacter sp.]|jgi:8-oxo-dGTP pyrophosphatase MutT (NUDIX family)|uniref:NUDIX hydrolase n=1 Tax=Acinetobacter sp. TaxID=472 RepID=UPI00283958C3|nr:NUDIX hydrolase [Acinetobacter sp.]MDR2248963.1 NUDIX hydrolase [Acinetobacter sp.]
MNQHIPSDAQATHFPVSVKGILVLDEQILLLKNERDEWELPGGKLEPNEDIPSCLIREIKEETGLDVQVVAVLEPYIYKVLDITAVLIIPFKCQVESFESMVISHEHKEIGLFDVHTLDQINLPEGYRKTIQQSLAY